MKPPKKTKTAFSSSRRKFVKSGALATAGSFMLPSFLACGGNNNATADFIFQGGSVITMDPNNSRAQALAVKDGRILSAGSLDQIKSFQGKTTQLVDLDGRTLMPGMIDPHAHTYSVVKDDFIIISPTEVDSFDDVMAKLKEGASKLKEGEWLLAADYDGVVTPGGRQFTLEDMNSIAPNNPFLLLEGSGHAAYANTLAYQAAGVTKDTPDPTAGRYLKDKNGELNGRMEELITFGKFLAVAQQLSDEEMKMRLLRMFNMAAKKGVTALGDPSVGQNAGMKDIEQLQSIMPQSPIRHRAFLVSTEMDLWEKNGIGPMYGDDMFRCVKVKAWSDGATQAFSSYLREPYLNSDSRGALNYTEEQLYEAAKRAHDAGWSLAVHANGDGAIDVSLNVFERILKENPRDDHRHRLEHCSVGHPDQFDRMKKLGVSPTFLIGHVRWWGKAFKDQILGPERTEYYDACKTALDKGIRFTFHSDYSVTPIEPLRYVQDAVTRVMHDGGEVFAPDQRIPVEEALKGVTINSAWQLFMDDITGSLEVGKYADLAILEEDPTKVDPMKIEKIQVSETWLGGKKNELDS